MEHPAYLPAHHFPHMGFGSCESFQIPMGEAVANSGPPSVAPLAEQTFDSDFIPGRLVLANSHNVTWRVKRERFSQIGDDRAPAFLKREKALFRAVLPNPRRLPFMTSGRPESV